MADEYGLEAALDEVLARDVVPRVKQAVKQTMEFLSVASPVYTGSYQGNHGVVLNSDDLPMSVSPEEIRAEAARVRRGESAPGRFAVPTSELVQRADAAMAGFELGDEIVIGNPVPHAALIEDQGTATAPEGNFYRRAAVVLRSAIDPSS